MQNQGMPKWFQKMLASIWIFGFVFLIAGALTSQTTNWRMVDAGLGLLAKPVLQTSQSVSRLWSIPAAAQCGTPCPVVVLNLNEILNENLKKLLSGLINQVLGTMMNLFDRLIQSISSAISGFDALADALGSFRAAIALKAQQVNDSVNETAFQFVDRVFPYVKEQGQKTLLANAVSARDTAVAINISQEGVTTPLNSTPSKAQIAENEAQITQVAKNSCVRPAGIPSSTVGLLGLQCGSAVVESSSVQAALAERDSNQAQTQAKVQASIENQAPADCAGKGYLQFGPTTTVTTSSGQTFSALSNFSVDLQGLVSTFDPKVLNAEQCNNLNRGPATLAATSAQANQSGNEFSFDSILQTFIEAISKFFTQLLDSVLSVVTRAISSFLSQVPGGRFFSQALGDLTGSIFPAINQQIGELTKALQDQLRN